MDAGSLTFGEAPERPQFLAESTISEAIEESTAGFEVKTVTHQSKTGRFEPIDSSVPRIDPCDLYEGDIVRCLLPKESDLDRRVYNGVKKGDVIVEFQRGDEILVPVRYLKNRLQSEWFTHGCRHLLIQPKMYSEEYLVRVLRELLKPSGLIFAVDMGDITPPETFDENFNYWHKPDWLYHQPDRACQFVLKSENEQGVRLRDVQH